MMISQARDGVVLDTYEIWDASTSDFLGCVVLDGPTVCERVNKDTKTTRDLLEE